MGLAVPSQAGASRELQRIKAVSPAVDDGRVTPVAPDPVPVGEPVSPELALVDPELAARLRASLPVIELEPPAPPLRAVPAPAHDGGEVIALRQPAHEDASLWVAETIPPTTAAGAPPAADRSDTRRLLTAFLAGAAVAAVVTTGVIGELGESRQTVFGDPGTVPPATSPAASGTEQSGAAKAPATSGGSPTKGSAASPSKPEPGSGKPLTQPRAHSAGPAKQTGSKPAAKPKQATRAHATTKQPSAPKQGAAKSGAAAKPSAKASASTPPAAKQADSAAEPRKFAWAPVAGAVAYRFELFRGSQQVLRATTKSAAFELGSTWRHRGHAEELSAGSYRWYVWPILPSGAASEAVVQARLTVP